MRFTIEQSELAQITLLVQRAAATRDTVPVLSGLLVQVSKEKGLTLTCTDLEIAITATTEQIQVEEEGTVLTNARYFSDLVKYLPETNILVSTDHETSRLVLTYGRSESHLTLYNPEEFPDVSASSTQSEVTIPQHLLKEMLRKTAFAAAVNHFKQVFTGVLFDLEESQLRIVASDTHRLAFINTTLDKPLDNPRQFVVPARTVTELTRILDDSTELVHIGLGENSVVFGGDNPNFRLVSRLLEGQYPNYLPVIPQNFISSVNVDTKELANVLERAVVMPTDKQSDKHSIRHITLSIREGEINIAAHSEKMGELNEIIENVTIEGNDDLQIAFNTRYFLDVVKVLLVQSPRISINFTGSLSPALIRDPDNQEYLYVLVPLITA